MKPNAKRRKKWLTIIVNTAGLSSQVYQHFHHHHVSDIRWEMERDTSFMREVKNPVIPVNTVEAVSRALQI